jgi:DNA polymerase I-like protein with 3'-5' exonuclease and polymerase domains
MQRKILKRQNLAPREPVAILVNPDINRLHEALPADGSLVAIDLETKGTEAHNPETEIVGIALANEHGSFYIDWTTCAADAKQYVLGRLLQYRLVAHNVLFDAAFLQRETGRWLDWVGCTLGLGKLLSTEGENGQSWSLETFQLEILGWPETNKKAMDEALAAAGLTKAGMWQLPADVLGHYAAQDADAAWQLWNYLTSVCAEEPFATSLRYHQREFMCEVRLLVEQQFRGIMIDQQRLETCRADNEVQITHTMQAFLTHRDVAHHIEAYNKEVHDAWKASEPPATTAKGETSKRWEAWRDREARHMADNGFNPNSKPQLADLFYNKLGNKVAKWTPTGKPVVDRKILPTLGEPGRLLAQYNVFLKRRGYISAVAEKSARDGLLHPQFNSIGTVTTRLGGSGGLNVQQMPKTADFLYAWRARPGHKLIQADAEALEPTILAEFSRDKALWAIYGPGAPKNDVYLYVAAKIEALGREIRKHYDPDKPTPEGIEAAKKFCKRDRSVAKLIHLASTYLAGPPKLLEILQLAGIETNLAAVRQMHRDYWRLFSGVVRFMEQLKDIWTANDGWIPTALGTPIAVADSLVKDINNRFCQTSGHQILQTWIYCVDKLRRQRGVVMYPWIVDLHDEQVWEAPDEFAEAAKQVLEDALAMVNAELQMEIQLKGPAQIVDNLAAVKVEGYDSWLEQLEDDEEAA